MAEYRLFIYSNAQDQGTGFTSNESQSYMIGATPHQVTLKSLKYTKKIYQPCEILAAVSVSVSGNAMPRYDEVIDAFSKKKAMLKIDDKVVATNYFVFKICPVFTKTGQRTALHMDLTICSADKLMSIDKYNKAYTGLKLGSGIILEEASHFPGMDTSLIRIAPQILGYTPDADNAEGQTDELRIPYAVQYDESLYDFIVRIANRCGEFVYFEDGKLCYGMILTDDNYTNDTTVIDWATKENAVQNRYYEKSDSYIAMTNDSYYGYKKRESADNQIYGESGYLYRSSFVAADEYLETMKKESTEFSKVYENGTKKMAASMVFKALNATCLSKMISDLIADQAKLLIDIRLKVENQNSIHKELNIDDWKDHHDKSDMKDQITSDDDITPFSTTNTDRQCTALSKIVADDLLKNLTASFYYYIQEKEELTGRQAVWLDFGSNYYNLKLGDKIRIEDKDYAVIQVEGAFDNDGQQLRIMAVPLYKASATQLIPIPPIGDFPRIREAKPQTAFVTHNLDIAKIGRIRVRYPWQSSDAIPSPWLRVVLPFATQGGSIHFKPQVGDEVMVDYIGGNIDLPFVAGFMYSGYGKEHWKDFPDRGIMSKNGHSLTFDDPTNGTNFFLNFYPGASFINSLIPVSELPESLKITDPKLLDFNGGFTITDRYGVYKISGSSDGRNVSIKSTLGDVNIDAFTGIKISAPNGDISITGKNVNISASNTVTISSGSNLKDRYFDVSGKAWITGAIEATAKVAGIDKLLDFTFIRTIMEVFLRPIDGTLRISSTTFLCMEAGKGKAEIPKDAYVKSKADALTLISNQKLIYPKIKRTLTVIKTDVAAKYRALRQAEHNLHTSITQFNILSGDEMPNRQHSVISFAVIKEVARGHEGRPSNNLTIPNDRFVEPGHLQIIDELGEFSEAQPNADASEELKQGYRDRKRLHEQRREDIINQNNERQTNMTLVKNNAIQLARAMNDAYIAANNWKANGLSRGPLRVEDVFQDILDTFKQMDTSDQLCAKLRAFNYDTAFARSEVDEQNDITILKRKLAYKVVNHNDVRDVFKRKNTGEPDYNQPDQWEKFTSTIYTDDSLKSQIKQWAEKRYLDPFTSLGNDISMIFGGSKNVWKPTSPGRILFSDNPSKTVSFSRNGINEASNVDDITDRFDVELQGILAQI